MAASVARLPAPPGAALTPLSHLQLRKTAPAFTSSNRTSRRTTVTAVAIIGAAPAVLGASCFLSPDVLPGAACDLFPSLVTGACCDLVPDLALGPACPCQMSVTLDGSEEVSVPTPVLPSGTMMAEFLLAYRRMLEHECGCGDSVAAAGEGVIERIKVGIKGLLGHPLHGAANDVGFSWQKDESDVEACLWELEKDMGMFHKYHQKHPAPIAVKLASVHCSEAARLLRRL